MHRQECLCHYRLLPCLVCSRASKGRAPVQPTCYWARRGASGWTNRTIESFKMMKNTADSWHTFERTRRKRVSPTANTGSLAPRRDETQTFLPVCTPLPQTGMSVSPSTILRMVDRPGQPRKYYLDHQPRCE